MKLSILIVAATAFVEAKKKCHKSTPPSSPGPSGEVPGTPYIKKEPTDLTRKYIDGATYAPSTTVDAVYNNGIDITASLKFDAKVPTVNLDNFSDIKDISCDRDLVSVAFENSIAAAAAFADWEDNGKWAVMIGYEKCKPTLTTLEVESVKYDGDKLVVIDTKEVDNAALINQYELTIAKTSNGLDKRIMFDRQKVWPLHANYNPANQSVAKPSIKLFEDDLGSISCKDCHLKGETTIGINVKGSMHQVFEYSVIFNGQIFANMDLELDVEEQAATVNFRKTLVESEFNPIRVPGVLKFGAGIKLDAGVTTDVGDMKFGYGFDVSYPFSFVVRNNRDGVLPQFVREIKPTFNDHGVTPKEKAFSISAHLYPVIDLELHAFDKAVFNLGVEMDNSADVSLSYKTGIDVCPNNQMELSVFMESNINVNRGFLGNNINNSLYASGKRSIACQGCGKCQVSVSTIPKTVEVTSSLISSGFLTSTGISASTFAAGATTTTTSTTDAISITTSASDVIFTTTSAADVVFTTTSAADAISTTTSAADAISTTTSAADAISTTASATDAISTTASAADAISTTASDSVATPTSSSASVAAATLFFDSNVSSSFSASATSDSSISSPTNTVEIAYRDY